MVSTDNLPLNHGWPSHWMNGIFLNLSPTMVGLLQWCGLSFGCQPNIDPICQVLTDHAGSYLKYSNQKSSLHCFSSHFQTVIYLVSRQVSCRSHGAMPEQGRVSPQVCHQPGYSWVLGRPSWQDDAVQLKDGEVVPPFAGFGQPESPGWNFIPQVFHHLGWENAMVWEGGGRASQCLVVKICSAAIKQQVLHNLPL